MAENVEMCWWAYKYITGGALNCAATMGWGIGPKAMLDAISIKISHTPTEANSCHYAIYIINLLFCPALLRSAQNNTRSIPKKTHPA